MEPITVAIYILLLVLVSRPLKRMCEPAKIPHTVFVWHVNQRCYSKRICSVTARH